MLPAGSWIGRPAPMAAAIGSSITMTGFRAPAYSAASWTARRSTPVMPDGMQMTIRGFAHRFFWWTRWMKYRNIFSQMSKSAITPSFRGRIDWMWPGVRPTIRLASLPTARMSPVWALIVTIDGSLSTTPWPRT